MKGKQPVREEPLAPSPSREPDRLVRAIRRLWPRPAPRTPPAPPDLKPCCPFDTVLEQRQQELARELEEVRGRINGLLFLLAGTVLTQVVLKLME